MPETLSVATILHVGLAPGVPEDQAEALWQTVVQPVVGAIHHTPGCKLGLVLAGELVEDLQQRHPEGIDWLRAVVDRGQVELVATALHEPVLSAVPERDAVGQVVAHATMLKKVFGVRPTGAWLPQGVWDPSVPRALAKAEIAWTLVDDRLVGQMTNQPQNEVHGVYRTEREGHAVALLPIDARVRDVAPDVQVKQVLAHLVRRQKRGHSAAVLAFPCNRFASAYAQTWLATLLAALERGTGGTTTCKPSEALALGPQQGRIYLPSGGPRDAVVPWERVLLRYEEANRLHKRMIRVSRLVERLERMVREGGPGGWRPDPSQLVQTNRYLYRAQAAPVYWHDPHAGIYDPKLRALAWRDVLRAERSAHEAMRLEERMAVDTVDVDCDGNDDVLLRSPTSSLLIDRAHSAGGIEWSVTSLARNLFDTLTRQAEPYHRQIREPGFEVDEEDTATDAGLVDGETEPRDEDQTLTKELTGVLDTGGADLARSLAVDARPRVSFVEHLIGPEVTVDDLRKGTYAELGHGLREKPWTLVDAERHGDVAVRALFYGDGAIEDYTLAARGLRPDAPAHPATPSLADGERAVRIHKRYTLHKEPVLDFRVEILNRGHEALRCRLALELDLALTGGGDPPVLEVGGVKTPLGTSGDAGDVQDARIEAKDLVLTIGARRPTRLWHYPIETVHRADERLVVAHQGVCLVLVWAIELFAQEKTRFDVRLAVETR